MTLAKSGSGIGTLTSSPPGISCGADCSETYIAGTEVTLTATPSARILSNWGGACSGTDPLTGGMCLTFSAVQLADNFTGPQAVSGVPDGIFDTIKQVNASPNYCFKVTPKANSLVASTTQQQSFRAWLRVVAIKPGGSVLLGSDRAIDFFVPPTGG